MRGSYALCFFGGGEKMHAMLLEKERVAVKMRHVVLKGDLVVLERFRKAGAAALGDTLSVQYVRKRVRRIGLLLCPGSSAAYRRVSGHFPGIAAGIFGIDADIIPRHGAADDALRVALRLIWGMFSPLNHGLPMQFFPHNSEHAPLVLKTRYKSA